MTDKPKNDNKSLLRRKALTLSIGLNAILIIMLLGLYVPSLFPPSPPVPELFYQLTATQLIANATADAMTRIAGTPSPEPVPTLSAEDEAALRNQFLNELETELGFLHPVLEDTVDSYIWAVKGDITYYNDNNGRFGNTSIPDNLVLDIDEIAFENAEYVAVVIPFHRGVGATRGFVFKKQNGNTELLAQAELGVILEPFADRNDNGFPDVAFLTYTGGSHGEHGLQMYEIRPNREFVNLTENLNASMIRFVDFDEDGILELEGIQQRFIPDGITSSNQYYHGQRIPRWFQWNGEAYEALPLIEGE